MVTYKRHIRDISSIGILCIEPCEVGRETCGRDRQIAVFACFCSSQNPLFSRFLPFSPILPLFSHLKSKFKKIKKTSRGVSKTEVLHPRSWHLTDVKYPKSTSARTKKTKSFLLVWWRHLTKCYNPSTLCLICVKVFLDKTIFKIGWHVPEKSAKQSRFLLMWWRHLSECYNPSTRCLICVKVFLDETIFKIGWCFPEKSSKTCHYRPLSNIILGIFNA